MNNTEQIQVQAPVDTGDDGLVTGFFAIGLAVNVLLIAAYILWACKQWGKKEKREE